MKTTLEMPDELFRRAKAAAARRGQSLKELVTAAIEHELISPVAGRRKMKREQVAAAERSLRRFDRLSRALSAAWPKGVSAVQAIGEQRREL